jgi:CubicO group peptidase (beta-lactamase class C family)
VNARVVVSACLIFTAISLHAENDSPQIVQALQPFVDSHTLAGAVTLVANKEKVLSVDTVGYSDVMTGAPMKADNLFWIASMSKPMTGAAMMILVDEGKVNVEDPVEKYLPEFKGQMLVAEQDKDHVTLKKPSRPITVHDVLSHISGMPFMSRVEKKIDQFSLKEATISYALTPLNTEPGAKYQYSNAGINIAGRIIEVVSGMPYEEFMEKRLFKPLGMKDTTFWPSESKLKHLAKAYKPNAAKDGFEETEIGQFTYPLTAKSRGPSPAGGYFSTAKDVGIFGRMLLNGGELDGKRYISEASFKLMTSKQTGALENGYGFGFSVDKGTGFGHGGAYATDLWVDPAKGLVLVYMVQAAGYPNKDGNKILPTFRKTAVELFGAK